MSQPAHPSHDLDDAVKPGPRRATNATANKMCRYYTSASGCKAGEQCKFRHETAGDPSRDSSAPGGNSRPRKQVSTTQVAATETAGQRRYQAPIVPASRVVPRPVPVAQLEDPRDFQLGQIRRRFKPVEKEEPAGTIFNFKLVPTDPDFPYEIDSLECVLNVPHDYPTLSKAKLRITNKEMRRGFQLNVENGFDEIAAASPNATLLGLMNRLDKALADLLSRPMAETIKLYRHDGPPSNSKLPETAAETTADGKQGLVPVYTKVPIAVQPTYTAEAKAKALSKRQADIRHVVARLGKSPGFSQGSDGVSFTLPPSVFRTPSAPVSISRAPYLHLIVPEQYNLVPCRIRFGGERTEEVQNVEAAFEAKARVLQDGTLLAHINYCSINIKAMAAQTRTSADKPTLITAAVSPDPPVEPPVSGRQLPIRPPELRDSDKSHVKYLSQPIEWSQPQSDSGDSDEDSFTDDTDYTDDETGEEVEQIAPAPTTATAEKGIMLSFPNLELHGIELLELQSLCLTVKCDRCKELNDYERLRNNAKGDHTGMKEGNCKKCGSSLAIGFRMDLIHVNSSRAGYIDLDGCTVVDMLPSTFVPTCSECSTTYTTPGCVSVRGDSSMAVCRECHRKMSFRIHEVKFLMVSNAAERATQGPIRRKVKENLGIVAGQELPRRGRCQHYSKSHRWFRFSCCSKVYPCDKCHDFDNPNHVSEFANRMIWYVPFTQYPLAYTKE
ncbi:hypothetical protein CAC42_6331 [Sphaceloma murrayae]|uniref:CHY-type domain-containing protein n=1 Tax=Sphaceloma murrayae TaxID=2082308 RepID=A0A2K1QM45_9PEZI|nr:hypothetical protein CAC42_6331 [Sphaceloma murrayae]